MAFGLLLFQEVAYLTVNQVGVGRTKERSQCEIKRLSEGAAVEGFKTALRVAEASGTANGAALAFILT